MNEKEYIELQRKIIEKLIPLDKLPKEISENALDYLAFRRELTKESDRGCALLAASHLDFLLEKMLDAKLIGTSKQRKALFEFNGPLGTFSSRILVSYSIGLLTKYHVDDLQIIRKVRNEFGHSPTTIDFGNPKISTLCNNLKLIVRSNKTPKAKFITSVSFISGGLKALATIEKRFVEKPEIDIEKAKDGNDKFRKILKSELGIDKQE